MQWSLAAWILVTAPALALAADPRAHPDPAPPAAGLAPLALPPGLFPIVAWDRQQAWREAGRTSEASLRLLADCQFTVAGFVRPEDLPLCERLGLAAIVAPPEARGPWFRNWRGLSADDIDGTVAAMVAAAGQSKAVIGYTLMDEPGAAAFPKLARAVAAVKRQAPGRLAHVNLYPNYATLGAPDTSQLGTASYREYLERFVAEVQPQLLCYDNYMVQYSGDLQDTAKAALYFANLMEVRSVAKAHGLPFWNVVCCNQIRKFTTIPSPASLALQAYTTLAAGARGITWFKYHQGGYAYAPVDSSGHKTETWQYLQVVNQQVRILGPVLNRLESTGVCFTSAPGSTALPPPPGRVIRTVTSRSPRQDAGEAPAPLMIGEFADGPDTDYAMLVNLSLEHSANITFETVRPYRRESTVSAVDARLVPVDGTHGHWLPAGHGVLVRLDTSAATLPPADGPGGPGQSPDPEPAEGPWLVPSREAPARPPPPGPH